MRIHQKFILGFCVVGLFMVARCAEEENLARAESPKAAARRNKGRTTVRLAIHPSTTPKVTFKRYHRLADYLTEETKIKVDLVISSDYNGFVEKIKNDLPEFILQEASSFFEIRESVSYKPIIKPLAGLYRGYFIVKADSDIETLQDLRGKRLLFGPEANAAKFLAPYGALKEADIDPEKDLEYEFGGMCPKNAMAVLAGKYDAGVICDLYVKQPIETRKFKIDGTDLKIIYKTDPVPSWILSASAKTDIEIVERVEKALLKLEPGSSTTEHVLGFLKWKGFEKITGKEFDRIEELLSVFSQ